MHNWSYNTNLFAYKTKEKKNIKYWYIFLGVACASLISDGIAYSTYCENEMGLSYAISAMIICGLIAFLNIILLIIGLIIKRILKKIIDKYNNRLFYITCVTTLIINLIIIFIVPICISILTLKKGEKYIINYLIKKYGDNNYEVVDTYIEYSDNGMWDKYLSGLYYEIKSDNMINTFIINTNKENSYVKNDYFLPVYYSEKNNLKYKLEYQEYNNSLEYNFDELKYYIKNIIRDKYQIDDEKIKIEPLYKDYVKSWSSTGKIEYNKNYFIIPDNYGKIPSIEEYVNSIIEYNKEL